MMRLAYVLALTAAASGCEKNDPLFCEKNPGATGCTMRDGAVGVDDTLLDTDPGVDAQQCFGGSTYSMCLTAPPMMDLVLSSGTLSTTDSPLCLTAQPTDWAANQPDSCIVVGKSITIPNTLNVSGTRPLVLVSGSTITITGHLDVASRRTGATKIGPGAPSQDCGTPVDLPTASSSGGGGGAGGSFLTKGGDGGGGNGDNTTGGSALDALASAPTARLRAGCAGQDGGEGDANNTFGASGGGGGAVYLVAATSITLNDNSSINASGAGAGKAGRQGGGGGGGSGGMIVLNAPQIMGGTTSSVLANGGGGSSGGNDTGGCGCNPGTDPDPLDPLSAAAPGGGGGGTGGSGFAQGAAAGGGVNAGSNLGGGGGGGGGGYIQSTVALTGITSSPTVVVLP